MTAWTTFASVAGVVTVLLLLASHTTSRRFDDDEDAGPRGGRVDADAVDSNPRDAVAPREFGADVEAADAVEVPGVRERGAARPPALSQPMLLLNVAFSQGVFAVVLVAAAVLADVPRGALGLGGDHVTWWFVAVGAALGVGLYAANEVGGSLADAAGLGQSEELRELLAPTSRRGWVVLLGGVLPIVAAFEELLFRGVLVGALATGFGVSPWLLVLVSSVLFGLGHGAQGRLGVLVTGTLGVVLAAAFVLSGSLVVVVVAHYLVNALEFVVHESVLGAE
ncbi:CPBP family intramembrane glutamic endopeptidase [Halorubellus sp. PRR65]|uniref:CPBP family intramembrane glutamic endopeptidase n=1 Tax=Halorubellus sp. PRR65 TaxID=3098148 RepID=UPI002B25C8A2|nr:CPBP family intramembrane glutamic endopeptidase [Halorubellus sp. PRR65]